MYLGQLDCETIFKQFQNNIVAKREATQLKNRPILVSNQKKLINNKH